MHALICFLHVHLLRTDMNLDGDCIMSVSCGNGKLRQWLIEQIDSGEYSGLVWENDEKTIFRIPWKHAGKQDYNRDEDAALFKVINDVYLSIITPQKLFTIFETQNTAYITILNLIRVILGCF